MNQENTKTFRCEKSAWNNTFQALGIIEPKESFWYDFVLNLKLLLSFYFLTNKSPNNGNQHCWKEIGDLDSFAPDKIDPYTENEAGAN